MPSFTEAGAMSDQSDGSIRSLGVNEGDEDVALAGDVNATTRSMAAGTERADVEDEDMYPRHIRIPIPRGIPRCEM